MQFNPEAVVLRLDSYKFDADPLPRGLGLLPGPASVVRLVTDANAPSFRDDSMNVEVYIRVRGQHASEFPARSWTLTLTPGDHIPGRSVALSVSLSQPSEQ